MASVDVTLCLVEFAAHLVNLSLKIVKGPLLTFLHLDQHLLHLFELLEIIGLHLFELFLLCYHHRQWVLHAEDRLTLCPVGPSEPALCAVVPALVKLVVACCDDVFLGAVYLKLVVHLLS